MFAISDDALAKAFADAYRGSPDGGHLAGLRAVADLVTQELAKGQEPVAWVRYCSDGGIEGPLLDGDKRMSEARRECWTPLGRIPFVAAPADTAIASAIHYPECWDTAAYPDLESAVGEVIEWFKCGNDGCKRPAVAVPAGVPDGWEAELLDWASACQSAYHIDHTPGHRFGGLGSNLEENREALVEYVRGLVSTAPAVPADAVAKDAERYRWLRSLPIKHMNPVIYIHLAKRTKSAGIIHSVRSEELDTAIDAAMAASREGA